MARAAFTLLCATLLGVMATTAFAKVWDRCELANYLYKHGFARNQLDTWLCIAYRESRYDSTHINYNSDGSKDYGLFQINNRYWCTNSQSPAPNQNFCNVSCDTVLSNVDSTLACIKEMYSKAHNTWTPWITYPYCLKEDLTQYTKGCTIA